MIRLLVFYFKMSDRIRIAAVKSFDGTRTDYLRFVDETRTAAFHCDSSYGLQAFYDFLTADEREEELELLAGLGPLEPPEPDDDDATAAQIAATERAIRDYKHKLKTRSDILIWFVDLIPLDVRDAVTAHSGQTFDRIRSVSEMRTLLHNLYGELTVREVADIHAEVEAPFLPGMSMREHIGKLNRLFARLIRANEGLTPFQQYHALSKSMLTHPDYALYVSEAASNNITTFQALSIALLSRSDHQQAIAAAHAARSVAAAVNSTPVVAVKPTLAAATHGHWEYPTEYCWTHGHGFHKGMECIKKGKGHKSNATAPGPGGSKVTAQPRWIVA